MQVIADFELAEDLFRAGNTIVCRARRRSDRRPVVLKVLGGDTLDAEDFLQFRREYELTASLRDLPGVICALAWGTVQDSVMIVEEDIGGRSLNQWLVDQTPGLEQVLHIGGEVAAALARVHERRVIHKDVNPSNIVFNPATGEVRLIDFGIASPLEQEFQEFQNVNQLEGTLAYLSPEQSGRVNRRLDARGDLYSLGATLYELLTGQPPFVGREGIALVHAHIAMRAPAPHVCNPAIPLVVSDIVMRLLEKMAEDRYQSARGVEHDLRQCLAQWRAQGRIEPFELASQDVSPRFQIPQKLYGREPEVAAIVHAFERVSAGTTELLLVGGNSGTGKSALVHEVHGPLTERHGSFVAGKFDQYQRDVPFHAWSRAGEEFCRLLLKEAPASLKAWRERILAAVGGSGGVLTEMIPTLEAVIGTQPAVPPLEGEQALNRRNLVFGSFLRAICRPEHPLVIFLDDWQWADAGSLSLLKAVMGDREIRHLLLIAAYRDNEVHESHAFAMALREIGGEPRRLTLAGLRREDVLALLADALPAAPDRDELAHLVHDKTQGNAFFVVQLLVNLYAKAAIRFSVEDSHWVWDRLAVAAHDIADNVVALMAEKIRLLDEDVRHVLLHAACIGDRFDLFALASILRRSPHEVAAQLEVALGEGVLLPIGSRYRLASQQDNTGDVAYRFIHDRVRQAAYGLLGEEQAERVHHRIATLWLAEFDEAQRQQHVFDIANQYNAARRLLAGGAETEALIDINLLAGKRAKAATAYATALQYFRIAIDVQGNAAWATMPARTAELMLLSAEAAFLAKDYAFMESALADYLAHVEDALARVQALRVRVMAYVAQNRLVEAVDVGVHALGLVGQTLPRQPGGEDVGAELTQTLGLLQGHSIEALMDLPPMTDPKHLAAMDLLGLTLPPAYWTSQELLGIVVFRMVRLSVEHGYSPNAGYGFSWWAILSCALLGQVDSGVAFGDFAIALAKRRGLNLQQPLFFDAWIVRKYKHALRETLPVFEETYALALEKGDFEYASYARNNHMQMLFHSGRELPYVLAEMERAHRDLERFQLGSSLYWHDIWWQAARNFAYAGDVASHLGGPAYDEALSLPQHLKVNDISSLFLAYCAKLMLACCFGEKEAALACADKALGCLPGGVGTHAFVLFHFYDALAVLANLERVGKRRAAKRVAADLDKLKAAAAHAPMNYAQHVALVEAERLRVANKAEQALRYYDEAIDLARDNGFLHEEALAHELAARCHLARGQNRLAAYYIKQGLRLYQRWGAAAKAARLEAEFAPLLMTAGGESRRGTITSISRDAASGKGLHDAFDIAAVTGAARAISGEIVLDKLVTTLLRLVMEHAGAQKAYLLLNGEHGLQVQACGRLDPGIAVELCDMPLEGAANPRLPLSLIRFVSHRQVSQVIADARAEPMFADDPYFRQTRPLSILCEPVVRQGQLMGLLYLENNLTTGAFTEDRLNLLRLLSSQAAIAIENAKLYHGLEQKVDERTLSLQAALAVQERLIDELQASSRQLEEAHARLSDANRQLQQQADTDGLTGLANRRRFNERLRYELDRCARERQPLALILGDLDHFKPYNDHYGHVVGDECLRRVAQAMRSVFERATDLVARYGGEEFVMLLPGTTSDQAVRLGETMRAAVTALAIPHQGNAGFGIVTVSAGCFALVPTADTVLDDVVSRADQALYLAKAQGRNRLVCLE